MEWLSHSLLDSFQSSHPSTACGSQRSRAESTHQERIVKAEIAAAKVDNSEDSKSSMSRKLH